MPFAVNVDVDVDFVTPAPGVGARMEREGGGRVVSDLSRLREGEAARREAREWVEGAGGGERGGGLVAGGGGRRGEG